MKNIYGLSTNMSIILLVIGIAVLLLVFFAVAFVVAKRKGRKSLVNEPFIAALKVALGGIENVNNVEVLQGRLKITVEDLDLVKLDDLKTLAETGVL